MVIKGEAQCCESEFVQILSTRKFMTFCLKKSLCGTVITVNFVQFEGAVSLAW